MKRIITQSAHKRNTHITVIIQSDSDSRADLIQQKIRDEIRKKNRISDEKISYEIYINRKK